MFLSLSSISSPWSHSPSMLIWIKKIMTLIIELLMWRIHASDMWPLDLCAGCHSVYNRSWTAQKTSSFESHLQLSLVFVVVTYFYVCFFGKLIKCWWSRLVDSICQYLKQSQEWNVERIIEIKTIYRFQEIDYNFFSSFFSLSMSFFSVYISV